MSDEIKKSYERALDKFGEAKFDEAAGIFREIIRQDPDFSDAYEALSRTYYKMNRLDEAIEWMEKLAMLKPAYAMAHTNLSIYYMKKGMKEKAEEEKAKAVVLNFGGQGPAANFGGE